MTKNYEWEVPAYQVDFTRGQNLKNCVIIPVINEGNRLHSLLEKIKFLNIQQSADIIIIDGGSTDTSLEKSKLESFNVHSLLTKTAPGKLSAQLRCAYAFTLEKNYENIVTIDGNDKDDPKDIPKFIEFLDQGYDFIQASRYVLGGHSQNTPLARDLAIRLIHAPMLSLSSGFKWTDTTQGFRGYSAQLLGSEKLKVFRNAFQDYELLAYLNHAAPRNGFKCIELGTSRIYPKGAVPTKISRFRGNWNLLTTLWKICRNHY